MNQAATQPVTRPGTSFLWRFTRRKRSSDLLYSRSVTRNREGKALTNLSRIFVVTRSLDKHQQFVSRRLKTFG